jgi:hypothetical protein
LNAAFGGKYELLLLEKLKNELVGFNIYERPAEQDNANLKVELGLTLQQIIDVVSTTVITTSKIDATTVVSWVKRFQATVATSEST